ncbi:hypothetical protein MRY87_12345 [bacterium]|nr:hypothetical protein [bacterium]
MIRFLCTFLLGLAVSNWIVAEFLYFLPEAEPVMETVTETITIPRHDEWKFERVVEEAQRVEAQLASFPSAQELFSDVIQAPGEVPSSVRSDIVEKSADGTLFPALQENAERFSVIIGSEPQDELVFDSFLEAWQ